MCSIYNLIPRESHAILRKMVLTNEQLINKGQSDKDFVCTYKTHIYV